MIYITLFVLSGPIQVLLGYIFIVLIIITALFNLAAVLYFHDSYYIKYKDNTTRPKKLHSVSIAITSFNESPRMIHSTIKSLKGIAYPKNKIKFYLVDDSTGKKNVEALRRICKQEKVIFIHRNERIEYKAGALNNFLTKINSEYFTIFDADETLVDPNIFLDNLHWFESDSKLISVQTIKKAKSAGLFADSIDETYAFFTKFIQPVRSRDKMAMFQGSCGILKTKYVKKIGGFPFSLTEDTALSFKADLAGYHATFIPKVYALGKPIISFKAFLTQQNRYGYGNASLVPDFLRNFNKYSSEKKMHYFTQVFGLHYLSIIYVIFALLTVVFALMGISAVLLSGQAFWQFAPKIAFTDLVPLVVTFLNMFIIAYLFFGSLKKGLVAYILNFSAALVRMRATFNAIFNRKKVFSVVKKGKISKYSLRGALKLTIRETSFALALLIFAIISFFHADIIGGLWLLYYFGLFSSAFVFAFLKG